MNLSALFYINPWQKLSSQVLANQVLSPWSVLSAVFGMGTGVILSLNHQGIPCNTLVTA
jgi:hypothetical protein